MNVIDLLGAHPVAYYPAVARAVGGVTAGLFLAQILYWTGRLPPARGGWLWKTASQMEQETALSRYEQESARKKLKEIGVLSEKKEGMPARMHYRVDLAKLQKILENQQFAEIPRTCMGKSRKHVRGKPANMSGENQRVPETTRDHAENTTTSRSRADGGIGGGGGSRPSDSLNAKTDIEDYLDLGMRYGGTGGTQPTNPAGWRVDVERRIATAGGLREYDLSQLAGWRRRAAAQDAAQDAAAARAAREAAAAAEKAAAEKAAADEASRLDALYDALPPAERDSIDAMAIDIYSPTAREFITPDTIRHRRREVVAEMYPPAGTQTDDRHLSDPSPYEPPADHGQEARGKVRDLVAGIGAQRGVRSPTRPRVSSAASREARERASREALERQAKVLGVR